MSFLGKSKLVSFFKKYKSLLIIIVIISLACGLTLIKESTRFYFQGINNEEAYGDPRIGCIFDKGTKYTNINIPLLYYSETYKSPYIHTMSIWGDFDSVKNVHAEYIINNKEIIKVPINSQDFKEFVLDSGPSFKSKPKDIDFKTEESDIKNFKLIIEFDGIKGNDVQHFKKENQYVLNESVYNTNILKSILLPFYLFLYPPF